MIDYFRNKNLEEYIVTLQSNATIKSTDFSMLESENGILKSEKLQVQSEMNAVNQVNIYILYL